MSASDHDHRAFALPANLTSSLAAITLSELLDMRLRDHPRWWFGRSSEQRDGHHHSRRHGPGTDLDSVGPWQIGDDPRHIDWHATARIGQLQVRRFFRQTQRPVLIIVDLREHLFFGLRSGLLARTACLAAAAISWRIARAQQPLALLALGSHGDEENLATLKPGYGHRARLRDLGRLVESFDDQHSAPPHRLQPERSLADALREPLRQWRRGGDAIIISDFSNLGDEFAAIIARRGKTAVHGVVIEDTAVRERFEAGLYPTVAGRGGTFETISIGALPADEFDRRVAQWHDGLTERLQTSGVSRVLRCDIHDLAEGRLR